MDSDLKSFLQAQMIYCDRCYTRVPDYWCPGCGRMWCMPPAAPVSTAQPAVIPPPWVLGLGGFHCDSRYS